MLLETQSDKEDWLYLNPYMFGVNVDIIFEMEFRLKCILTELFNDCDIHFRLCEPSKFDFVHRTSTVVK